MAEHQGITGPILFLHLEHWTFNSISRHLNVCLATAIHIFKWLKILRSVSMVTERPLMTLLFY